MVSFVESDIVEKETEIKVIRDENLNKTDDYLNNNNGVDGKNNAILEGERKFATAFDDFVRKN
jgi:hypothetical protein